MPTRCLHVVDGTVDAGALAMLALLVRRSHYAEHHVVAVGHKRVLGDLLASGVPASRLRFVSALGFADFAAWRRLRRVVEDTNCSLLHAWSISAAFHGTAQGAVPTRRIVSQCGPLAKNRRRMLRAIVGKDESFFTITGECFAESLISRDVSPDRLRCIVPGVQPAAADIDVPALRDSLGLSPVAVRYESLAPVIALDNVYTREARQENAIWVGGILAQIYPSTRLLVPPPAAGSDARTWRRVRHFISYLSRPEMAVMLPQDVSYEGVLQAADVFVSAAGASGGGGAMLAAMAAGLPIIATPVPATAEIVQHGRNALLAKNDTPRALAARVRELMTTPDLPRRLADQARADVFRYHKASDMVAAFDAIYAEMAIQDLAWRV